MQDNWPKQVKTFLKILFTLIPLVLWGFINVNLELMSNHQPTTLWIHAPSTLRPHAEGDLIVEAWDKFERVSSTYDGRVSFSIRSYSYQSLQPLPSSDLSYDLPAPYQFQENDHGRHTFSFSITTEGVHYLLVQDSHTEYTYWSNPIIINDSAPNLVWGDIHAHSLQSDGSGRPEKLYEFARNVAGLEFCALTDHGEQLHMTNSYSLSQKTTNAVNDPGQFVALQGVEWTGSHGPHTPPTTYGHYTCVTSAAKLPHISADIQKTPDELWNAFDTFTQSTGKRMLALPHHTVRESFVQDWAYVLQPKYVNQKYVRLAEVYSVHGSSLFNPYSEWSAQGSVDVPSIRINGSSINAALQMGLKLGLLANGDTHDGRPGHSISHTGATYRHQPPLTFDYARLTHPYPSGLIGAFTSNLTRKGIFGALFQRKVLATSDYGRPFLHFSINGVHVGEQNSTVVIKNKTSARKISVFLALDGNPPAGYKHSARPWTTSPNWNATIQIFKNGRLWEETQVDQPVARVETTDTTPLIGANYSQCIERGDNYYINSESTQPVDPTTLHTHGKDVYFVRIISNNLRFSTVGPLWATAKAK